jgi:hypothetical protein
MLNEQELLNNLAAMPANQDDVDREWFHAFHVADQQYTTEYAQDFADFREHYASQNMEDMTKWETMKESLIRWRTAVNNGERSNL